MITTSIVTSLCLGCLFTLPVQAYRSLGNPTAEEGQQKANELIKALESYKTDIGNYPPSLDLLVPKYLPAIPRPSWVVRYDYELLAGEDEFIIIFDVGISFDGDFCEYSSKTQTWSCSDRI